MVNSLYDFMSVAVTPLLLSDKTWTAWSDVQNDKGHVLIIGSHSFRTKGEVTFTKENHFRDVFAVLRLMMDLFLEPHSVPDNQSLITDSLMLRLKSSSTKEKAGSISSNSFGKVNKKFCRYVIDLLSVQLVFDNWHPFAGQNAPSPFVKETPPEVIRHIKHNQDVLVSFCVQFNPLNAISVFKEKTLGWEVPSLKTLFSTGVTYKHKLDKGIISSWKKYPKNHVSTN